MSELGGTGLLEKERKEYLLEAQRKKRIELLDQVMSRGSPFLLDRMEELRDELVDRVYLVKEISVPCSVCRGVGEFCSACMGTGRTGL